MFGNNKNKEKEKIIKENKKRNSILFLVILSIFTSFTISNFLFKDMYAKGICIDIAKANIQTKKAITEEFSKCINSISFMDKEEKKDIINHLYFPPFKTAKDVTLINY